MKRPGVSHALGFGVLTLAILHVGYYFPRTVDDMFIFLRYAENLVNGQGLTFNPGEPVEGFSSPLWVLALAAGSALGINGVSLAKFLSLLSFAGLLGAVWAFARIRLRLSAGLAWLSTAFVVANSYVVSWTAYGLETPAYLALLMWTGFFLDRSFQEPRWMRVVSGFLAAAFVLSRPEAPFLFGVLVAAVAIYPPVRARLAERAHALWPAMVGGLGAFIAWTAIRLAYYGLPLPHTYYAKFGTGFTLSNLKPMVAEGAGLVEVTCVLGGLVLAIWLVRTARMVVPLAAMLGTLYFASTVAVDWMPNMRHFLPVWVFLPLGWCMLATRGAALNPAWLGRVLWVAPVLLLVAVMAVLGSVDSKFSRYDFPSHGRGKNWSVRKNPTKAREALDCLTHRVPASTSLFDDFNHGMISQLYLAIEADARPLESTWFVGRDIGRVGYLAPVRIFETDGLFTPAVVQNAHWLKTRRPDRALVEEAFSRPVVMTELLSGWGKVAMNVPLVRSRYQPLRKGDTLHWVAKDRKVPESSQIVRRYDEALRKMPQWFYVMTLYGEPVGALLERRTTFARWNL